VQLTISNTPRAAERNRVRRGGREQRRQQSKGEGDIGPTKKGLQAREREE